MNYSLVTISSKGQFTVPKWVRERLRLKPGDRLSITVDADDGAMVFTPMRRSIVEETTGSLAKDVRRYR